MSILPTRKPNCRCRRAMPRGGFALVIVMGIAAFTAMVVLGMMRAVETDMATVGNSTDTERAYYLAEAAVEHGKALLLDDPKWSGESKEIAYPLDSKGSYKFSIQQDGKEVVIYAKAQYGGIVRTIEYHEAGGGGGGGDVDGDVEGEDGGKEGEVAVGDPKVGPEIKLSTEVEER